MKTKLPSYFRAAILLLSVAMIAVLYLPIWKIELSAPQYLEGLSLRIYAGGIGGDVDVVNGLNHYIGMHTLHTRDFIEFVVLPYIICGFAVLGLGVVLINRRIFFYSWAFLFLLIAVTSMIDFYRWEYSYGHNLDPRAPIQVPGMAYQPPLLGYKQLLNFGAFSIPGAGGWIFAGVGIAIALLILFDLRKGRSKGRFVQPAAAVGLIWLCWFLSGCTDGPQSIQYGQDICTFCKMGFADKRFGGEVCTRKGKVYKFDDLQCLLSSLASGLPERREIKTIYLIDFAGGGWIKAPDVLLWKSTGFRTPMGSDIAAFQTPASLQSIQQEYKGQPILWKDLYH